ESADVVQTFVGGLELPYVLYIQEPQSGGLKLKKNPKPTLYQRFLPPIVTGVCPRLPGFDLHGLVGSSNCDVVPLLIIIDLVNMDFLLLIQRCSGSEKILQSFSQVVIPLADGLKYCSDVVVKWSITCALERLSNDLWNCVLIYQRDALKSISAVMNRIPG
ncbi:hypothetical protein P5673_015529, partial [Acropora cervicornis]